MSVPSAGGYSASDVLAPGIKQASEDAALGQRMKLAHDVNKCLNGDIFEFVDRDLRATYHVNTYRQLRMQSGISTRLNPMARGVSKVDKSWSGGEAGSDGATYELDGAADDGGDVFKEHVKRAKIDNVTRECSRCMWVHPGFCAAPVVTGDRMGTAPRKFITRMFTPDRFNAIPMKGAPGILMRLELYSHDPDAKSQFKRLVWTDLEWVEEERKAEGEQWRVVDGGPNEYGCIPAVLARPNPHFLWADNFGPELLESTIRINSAQTLLSHQSHSQVKALFGDFGTVTSGQVLSQGAGMVDAAGASNMQLVDFQTNQEGFRKVHIDGEWAMAAELLGFPADEFDGTSVPQSGEALKVRLYTALQNATGRQWWLKEFAEHLYWMGLRVLSVELGYPAPVDGYDARTLPPFDPSKPNCEQPVRFCVEPKPITLPLLSTEVAAQEDRDMALGFTSVVDLMKARNPGMTEEDALAELQENVALNAKMRTDPAAAVVDPVDAAPQGATVDPAEAIDQPDAASADPATGTQVDAAGKPQSGTTAAVTLNGAQITAALEVVSMLADKKLAEITATELLVAVGIERGQAESMVAAESARQKAAPMPGPTPPVPPPPQFQPPPTTSQGGKP